MHPVLLHELVRAKRFSPGRLYTGGFAGHYSDLRRQDSMRTVVGGDVPVLLPGDPIGEIRRRPGSFDWSQPTSAARPVWARFPRGGIRNRIRNNTMQGAAAGQPGTLPTYWPTGPGGLTREIVGRGVIDGIHYIDFRWYGTTTGSQCFMAFETGSQIPAESGQAWTASAFVAVIGGSTENINNIRLKIPEFTDAGSYITEGSLAINPDENLQRYTYTRTLSGGSSTKRSRCEVFFTFNAGVEIDITLRIGLPQFELGSSETAVQKTAFEWDITEPGQPSIYLPYYSGSQWMDSGVTSFGNASLFADAGQEWTTISLFRTLSDTAEAMLSRQSTADATGTFSVYKGSLGGGLGRLNVRCRGANTGITAPGNVGDGRLHLAICRWNSAAGDVWVDGASPVSLNVGTSAEETGQNIISGGRANGASLLYDGHLANFLIDRALTNSEIDQVRAWAANTYGVQM